MFEKSSEMVTLKSLDTDIRFSKRNTFWRAEALKIILLKSAIIITFVVVAVICLIFLKTFLNNVKDLKEHLDGTINELESVKNVLKGINFNNGKQTINDLRSEEAQKFNGNNWIVLVAGSNGWDNYRHQADIYHAYQIVHKHGIPDSNIIVFHYDDLAENPKNPTPGIVINKPGGQDVYNGVPKDYTGADVTPKNFLAAIQGDEELASQGKKVVKSGPNDHIFIYFADHGAPGLIAFPSKYLYANDLNIALKSMHQKNRYSKLVFYLEACESGSMFKNFLPQNINVYATTAANSIESSYACYYDEKRDTYLGDVYSVNWLENSDLKTFRYETLDQQFKIVLKETNTSHVQEYGDLNIGKLPIEQFQGEKVSENQFIGGDERKVNLSPVDSGNVVLEIIQRKIERTTNFEELHKLNVEKERILHKRFYLENRLTQYLYSIKDLIGSKIEEVLSTKQEVLHKSCYRQFVDTFHSQCLNLNQHPFVLRKLYIFANVCEKLHQNNSSLHVSQAVNKLGKFCEDNYVNGFQERIL